MKILISGGHLTPALAFIDYALTNHPQDTCVFVGRTFSQSGNAQKSQEKAAVLARGVKFVAFHSGKLSSYAPHILLSESLSFLRSLWEAEQIIRKERPHLFLSFGGYLALPLACIAFLHRLPIITHEQTRTAGVANRFIAKIATIVALSYPESQQFFAKEKTTVIGNPIRPQLLTKAPEPPAWLQGNIDLPILYITGGSQGSQFINTTILQVISQLTKEWVVIHQCGNPTKHMNYYNELMQKKKTLPPVQQRRYFISEWLTENEQAWIYQHAHAIVSRAGANTVHELMTIGKPAIFIPLPQSHDDEQLKNALAMEQTGSALIIQQKNMSAAVFLETLKTFNRKYRTLARCARANRKELDNSASQQLYQLAENVYARSHR